MLCEALKRDIAQIAACVNDTRFWQRKLNEFRQPEIARHFVGDACRFRRFAADGLNIIGTELAQFVGRDSWYEVGIRWPFGTANTRCKIRHLAQLAGTEHLWVARENLLNQR